MTKQNPLLDDLAGLMTGAMGAARTVGEEARTAMQSQAARLVADMDMVNREEFETLKQMLQAALERIEVLEGEIEALKRD